MNSLVSQSFNYIYANASDEAKADVIKKVLGDVWSVIYFPPEFVGYSDFIQVVVCATSLQEAVYKAIRTKTFRDHFFCKRTIGLCYDPIVKLNDADELYCLGCDKYEEECSCDRVLYDKEGNPINEEGWDILLKAMLFLEKENSEETGSLEIINMKDKIEI